MSAMTKLTKDQFIPFLDTAKDADYSSSVWKRIDYSTIFELAVGEQEEDVDYICYANPVTEINSNKPELPQEIAIYEGNPVYDFLATEFYNLPVGEDCKTGCLICFGGTGAKAWRAQVAISDKTLNTVDGVITFTLKFGGTIEKGTYTISEGVPTFVTSTP